MRPFYAILANTFATSITNTFVWFAVTFWVYLETKSVLATSVMAGVYVGTVALSGFLLGSIVDRYRKRTSMMISNIASLVLYVIAAVLYATAPAGAFKHDDSILLWVFILLALFGALAGNLRGIALPTIVTIMIPPEERDKANGMVGTVNGVSFLLASIMSGMAVGFLGMFWILIASLILCLLSILHLLAVHIPEKEIVHGDTPHGAIDVKGTIKAIHLIPGLFALIFFNTFNNFLGGVFMSLMDPYGLTLVSVQVWGILWGVLSLGFILGGIMVAKRGLGERPIRTLFLCNVVMWIICIFFTIQASIVLLGVGVFIYMCLIPVIEAAEQTILQKAVPLERQGRVFGFAQSIEQAASPITAFVIGPVAHFIFIPFMTTGKGVELFGSWFGVGTDRGIALIFIIAGTIGLIVTLLAMRSSAYRQLSQL
ncbi:MFS transporter [Chitinophaga pendula]|uniref:MFS transporter n=1 Tax=Chitinophaga TaxID=79328 RepID=UPI000BAEA3BF|nr:MULTISPECIES: MFS transporter [Chitinophaga]ASZ14672.1 MFS transporter [Chitinophaga sp. MD30]UCJ07672.1 MFS transporter [Chitinophaga pendula]